MAPGVIEGPGDPVDTPPPRRPGSVRRTSSVLMSWPDGLTGDLLLEGRARDLHTPADGEAEILDHADLLARTGRMRDIQRIEADPEPPGLQQLVGFAAGGNLRKAIAQTLPEEVEAGTPLYLLLDDLAGASLISGFAFFKWADAVPEIRSRVSGAPTKVMQNICSGFREGSSALNPDGTLLAVSDNTPHPHSLVDPADPLGWHELHPHPAIAMRRARRIDVWFEEEELQIDAMFRDSVWDPEGLECVLHEYQMFGWADAEGTLRARSTLSLACFPMRSAHSRHPTPYGWRGRPCAAPRRGAPETQERQLLHPPQRRSPLSGGGAPVGDGVAGARVSAVKGAP